MYTKYTYRKRKHEGRMIRDYYFSYASQMFNSEQILAQHLKVKAAIDMVV